MDMKPLDLNTDVDRFIAETKGTKPDGLLLIPFKKAPSGDQVMKIINETKIPAVVLATLGVLLIGQIKQFSDHNGVYMINSLDNLDAVENGLKMIKTRVWLQNALIVNIGGANIAETTVPFLGTTVRRIPHQRFYDYFANTIVNSDVKALANHYMAKAIKISQPKKEDIIESAKSYFIFKKILTEEKADALMMDCLPGLKVPHKHVPPCMGYMSLRDEGIAMGCESDLDATLSMMLLQDLFGKPGFQHNPSYDTENDCYFCAHCTSASKMNGVNEPSEPFELMSHAEAGWGTVPRVHFKEGQEVTIAKYLAKEEPQLLLYSGNTISCPPIPPTGACRTNVTATLNELEKGTDLKGHHLIMIYGNYVKQLKRFSQLFNIEVVV
jgi:L-fucose isomerase-like protein